MVRPDVQLLKETKPAQTTRDTTPKQDSSKRLTKIKELDNIYHRSKEKLFESNFERHPLRPLIHHEKTVNSD